MDKLLIFPGRTEQGVFNYVIDTEKTHLEKTACEYHPTIADYIHNAKPIPGKIQILLTALGAGETWGFNANGDYFPEAALAHEGQDYGYKTFESTAKIYKHHCFIAGTRVKTLEGFLPIQDVAIGMKVLAHTGTYETVTDTFKNKYKGPLLNMKVQGLGRNVVCTPEHRFLVVKREQITCPTHRNGGKNYCTFFRNNEETCKICKRARVALEPTWVEAQDLRVGDLLTQTRDPVLDKEDPSLKHWGTLLGFFLAEGCYAKKNGSRYGLQFTFGKDEHSYIQRLRNSASALGFSLTGPYIHNKNNTALVMISSRELADRIFEWCGEYSHHLNFTPQLVNYLGREGSLSMIGAYIDGDGHVYKSGRNLGVVRARSSSFSLLESMRDLSMSLGVFSSFCVDSPKQYRNAFGNITQPSGFIMFTPEAASCLRDYSEKCEVAAKIYEGKNTKKGSTSISMDHLWLHRVSSIEEGDAAAEDVFNLEVEHSHSYQVYGLNTHNCNKDPSASFGDVALSVYNPKYRRVELIVVLDVKKAPDIAQRIEAGETVDWSMGCKVPYDICNLCGNKAPTRKEYCEHLKYYIGRIYPPLGRVAYAINTMPKFFDISYVFIGADRIAKSHLKVASKASHFPSSAWLAEKMAEQKEAAIEKEVPAGDGVAPVSMATVSDLAAAITEVKAHEKPLPKEVLNNLAKHPLSEVMSTLAMLGILPKPQEFQRIYLVSRGRPDFADQLDRENVAFDPMSVEAPSGENEQELGLNHRSFNPFISKMMSPFMEDRSYIAPLLGKRITIILEKRASFEEKPVKLIKVAAEPGKDDKRKPVGIIPMLAIAAGLYAAFAKHAPKESLKGIDKILASDPGLAAAIGLGLMATFNPLVKPGAKGNYLNHTYVNPDANDVFSRIEAMKQKPYVKLASMGPAAKRLLLGIPLAYMASGVLQKHRELNPYDEESRVKSFIRRYPDVVSGALVADAMLSAKGRGTHGAIKKVAPIAKTYFDKGVNALKSLGAHSNFKTASAQEYLSNALIWPLAMGGGNIPGKVVSGLFDQAVLDAGSKLLERRKQKKGTQQV